MPYPNYGNKFLNSFFPYITKIWNNLPTSVKSLNLLNFKTELRSYQKPDTQHPPSENRDVSVTEHPVDPRPVCKLEFDRCGPVEKHRVLFLSWRFEHIFPSTKLRFSTIFEKIPSFLKILREREKRHHLLDSSHLYTYLNP